MEFQETTEEATMQTKRGLIPYILVISVLAVGILAGIVSCTNDSTKKTESTPEMAFDVSSDNEFDVITIENEGYTKDRKGPVKFNHLKHALNDKILCWECHHDYADKKNNWVPWGTTEKCAECHMPSENVDNLPNLQKAYHLNCRNCHKDLEGPQKQNAPYRQCYGCHEKTK